MEKKVGNFTGSVTAPYPCFCEIHDGNGGVLTFNHTSISDLEYLITQMKKTAYNLLPEDQQEEI